MPRVPVPFSDYSDTRLSADEQSCVNMYPHSRGGLRQFPGSTVFSSSGREITEVSFSSGAYLRRLSDLDGINNNSQGSVSFWFKHDGTPVTIYDTFQSRFTITLELVGKVKIVGKDTSGTTILDIEAATSLGSGQWHHCIASWTLGGTPTAHLYIDDEDDLVTNTLSSGSIDYTQSAHYVAATSSGNDYDGELAEFWFYAGRYINVSVDSSRAKFLTPDPDSSSIRPSYLGQDGSLPIGFAPTIYLANEVATWQENLGTGGDFSEVGTISAGTGLQVPDGAIGQDRGGIVMDGIPYFVLGNTLVSFNSSGTATEIGTIDGSARCVLDTDGTQLVICAGAKQYQYTVSGGLVEITDATLSVDCNSAAYLDSRFYFEQGSQFYASALNDATDIDALDVASAESFSDDIVRLLTVDQLLYIFGSRSIEIWYSSGTGRPPVDRQEVIDEVGLIGTHAVTVIDNTIYFVDEQRRLNRMRGTQYEPINVPALGVAWTEYGSPLTGEVLADTELTSFSFNQENFIQITFPFDNVTWTYHEPTGKVFKNETLGGRYRISTFLSAYGYLLGADNEVGGYLYELSIDSFQDVADDITRTVDTQLITSELYGAPGRDMTINGIFPTFEASGSGTVTVSISKDGGAFGNSRDISVTSGTNKFRLHQWGKCREAIFRFTTTSNIKLDFVSLSADAEILND